MKPRSYRLAKTKSNVEFWFWTVFVRPFLTWKVYQILRSVIIVVEPKYKVSHYESSNLLKAREFIPSYLSICLWVFHVTFHSRDLSHNNLSGTIPYFLGQVPSLTFLYVSRQSDLYCKLYSIEPLFSFFISYRDLSSNDLNGPIPMNLLQKSQDGFLTLRFAHVSYISPLHLLSFMH